MKRKSYAKARDANEPEIVKALQGIGATVERLDFIDMVVGYKGGTSLMEVKNPAVEWHMQKAQRELLNRWKGSPIYFVTNAENAINIVKRNAVR